MQTDQLNQLITLALRQTINQAVIQTIEPLIDRIAAIEKRLDKHSEKINSLTLDIQDEVHDVTEVVWQKIALHIHANLPEIMHDGKRIKTK